MVLKISTDYSSLTDEDCFDAWADSLRPIFFVNAISERLQRPVKSGALWMLDRVMFLESEHEAQILHRTRRHCSADAAASLGVTIYRYGGVQLDMDGASVSQGAGFVNFMDFSRPHREVLRASHHRSVNIPHDLVGYDPSIHPAHLQISTETALGRILFHCIEAIFDSLDRATDAEAPAIASGLVGLIRSVLFHDPVTALARPGSVMARGRAIRAFADDNVGDRTMDADAVSKAFNISRSTLYREFRDEGGFDRYFLGRRLEAALTALVYAPAERGAVSRAAEHFGFSSVSHFSREFRGRFGFSPSDIVGRELDREARAARLGSNPTSNGAGDLETFLRNR
ncbi:MAG: helix-turn-helix domain-containing protein [Pseudomonadota bacterium]